MVTAGAFRIALRKAICEVFRKAARKVLRRAGAQLDGVCAKFYPDPIRKTTMIIYALLRSNHLFLVLYFMMCFVFYTWFRKPFVRTRLRMMLALHAFTICYTTAAKRTNMHRKRSRSRLIRAFKKIDVGERLRFEQECEVCTQLARNLHFPVVLRGLMLRVSFCTLCSPWQNWCVFLCVFTDGW